MENVEVEPRENRITNEIKKNNMAQLNYIAKDTANLAARMKTLNPSNPGHADALGSSVVEASFFVNAYGLAAQAFKNMVSDLENEENGPRGDVLFYLFEEAKKFEAEIQAKKENKEEPK